jgi:hypothetical protein
MNKKKMFSDMYDRFGNTIGDNLANEVYSQTIGSSDKCCNIQGGSLQSKLTRSCMRWVQTNCCDEHRYPLVQRVLCCHVLRQIVHAESTFATQTAVQKKSPCIDHAR